MEVVLWGAGSGFIARWLLQGAKPGFVVTVGAGFGGCLLGFVVGHELLRIHEFHLFKPESLIPAVTASAILLVCIRRATSSSRSSSLFR